MKKLILALSLISLNSLGMSKVLRYFTAQKVYADQQQKQAEEQRKYSVIAFDSTDVLVHSNMNQRIKLVGVTNIFRNILNPSRLGKAFFFDTLRKLKASEWAQNLASSENPPKDNKGRVTPPIMHDYHKGLISGTEIHSRLSSLNISSSEKGLVLGMAANLLPENLGSMMYPDKKMIELIKTLKEKGYKVVVFSNFAKDAFEVLQQKYTELYGLFDDIILSSDLGDIKPCQSAYKKVAVRLGVKPEQIYMIDDKVQNVEEAKKAGLGGFVFTKYDDLVKDFEKVSIL